MSDEPKIKEFTHPETGTVVQVSEDELHCLGPDFDPVKSSKDKKKEAKDGDSSGPDGRNKASESASGSGRANPSGDAS